MHVISFEGPLQTPPRFPQTLEIEPDTGRTTSFYLASCSRAKEPNNPPSSLKKSASAIF